MYDKFSYFLLIKKIRWLKESSYFPIQKVIIFDIQLVMKIGQQIGNKICKIDDK